MMRLPGPILVVAAALWGGLVFVVSSGDGGMHMARMVGYGTFLVEHLLFGLALGLVVLAVRRPARLAAS